MSKFDQYLLDNIKKGKKELNRALWRASLVITFGITSLISVVAASIYFVAVSV